MFPYICMMEIKDFIQEHLNDSTEKLLFSAKRYPDIDVKYAVKQIIARQHIKDKLPSWYLNFDLIFPSQISTEQASSEITALYKQRLVRGTTLCDMTGGLGIDSFFFAQKVERLVYIERFAEYVECAKHNFQVLGAKNIETLQGDSTDLIENIHFDTLYIDPARRGISNKRLFALEDCEPNVVELIPQLCVHAQRIIIKISPMADISECIRVIPSITEIHILSVKNECKELLLIIDQKRDNPDIKVVTYNASTFDEQIFEFFYSEESSAQLTFPIKIGNYLYEPNSSILKAGAFKIIAQKLELLKLHPHSHLYCSDEVISHFPGRSFRIEQIMEATKKNYKDMIHQIPQANITTRNFPLSVADIRKKTKIKEGGNLYLFATTLIDHKHYFIICSRINS